MPAVPPAGFPCSRAELSEDIKQLYQTGLFESVNARVLPQKKGNKFKVRAGVGRGGAQLVRACERALLVCDGECGGACEGCVCCVSFRALNSTGTASPPPPPATRRPPLAQVVFDFVEKRYPEIQTFNVEGARVLPKAVVKEVRGGGSGGAAQWVGVVGRG